MSTPGKSRPDASGSSNWHVRLREVLESYFDENDIETLCFDLRFDYERLAGEGKTRKIVELIKEFARLGRVGELIDYCSRQRPNIQWAELREAALKNPLVVDREPDVGQAGTTPHRQEPEPPAPKRSSLPSIVAIALVALAVVVLIVRPSPPFPPPEPTPTPTWSFVPPPPLPAAVPVSRCDGTEIGGHCWYFGEGNASCDTVCVGFGGYDEATRTYAGSDGFMVNCRDILLAMNLRLSSMFKTEESGLGCFVLEYNGSYYGFFDAQPTTAFATTQSQAGLLHRICACGR